MPGERTEQATQHRREKARREGDILHSRELTAAAGTLAAAIALGVLSGRTMEAWRSAYAQFLVLGAPTSWEPGRIQPTLLAIRRLSLAVIAPPMIAMAAGAVAAAGTAGGWRPCRNVIRDAGANVC